MTSILARNWGWVVLRGVLAILFGLAAFFWPGITVTVLVLLFGAYAIVDGIFAIIAGVRRATEREARWWLLILEGLVGIAAGIIAFVWPGVTALALLYIIAAWAIVTGVLEILSAIRLRQEIEGEFWLALGGLLSLIFGILLLVQPAAGILAVIWLIGVYAIVFGIALLVVGFRLRGLWHEQQRGAASPL